MNCEQCVDSLTNKDMNLCLKCHSGTLKYGQCYTSNYIIKNEETCTKMAKFPCAECNEY